MTTRKLTRREALAVASGVMLTGILTACGGASSASPSAAAPAGSAAAKASAGPKNKLTVAFGIPLGNPSNPFAWIGSALGYFDAENIDVDFQSLGGDNARGDAMLASGQIDVGIFGLEQILRAAAKGTNVDAKAVYNVQTRSQYEGIVPEDSSVKNMQDLKGKTVAIPQLGATLETYVDEALKDAGMAPGDVKFLATGVGPQMGEALKRGEVAAAFGTSGQVAPLALRGYKFRYLPRPKFADNFITGNMVARGNLPPDRQAALKGYLRAYSKALVFSRENPEAAMLVNWKMYPEAKPKGISDADALKQAVGNYKNYLSYIDRSEGKWGYMPPEKMLAYLKYLGLEGKVDITKYYTNDYITLANDFDEAKVRDSAKSYKVS